MARVWVASCTDCAWVAKYTRRGYADRAAGTHTCTTRKPRAGKPTRAGEHVVAAEEKQLLELATAVARAATRRYRLPLNMWPDVLSDATLGVTQAAASYNPTGKSTWRGWVWTRAQGAILDGLRDRSFISRRLYTAGIREADLPLWQRPAHSLDAPIADGLTVGDVVGWTGGIDAAETRIALHQALAVLTERERAVLLATEVEGALLHEVGAALGVTQARVSQIRKRALEKARRAAA